MKTNSVSQIKSIVAQAEPILKRNNRQKETDTIAKYLINIDNRETNVLICGEFKRGKSSFINAFLEQEVCPVDTDIATAAVSVIKYGEEEKVIRQFGDIHKLQTEEYRTLECIEKFAKGDRTGNTVLLIIEIPNPKLKDGLVLIDTPGVGGLDPRHAFLTNYFLPRANIVLFITDKDQPITGAEKSFLENKVIPFAMQKALIINKADLMSSDDESEKWIEDAKTKCSDKNAPFTVIPVSSKLKKDYLKKGKKEYLTESNFLQVEKLLETLIDNYKKTQLIELRDYLVLIFNEMIVPLKLQIDQIKEPNPELEEKLKKELIDYKTQREQLENPSSVYRSKINKIINETRAYIETKLSKESVNLTTNVMDKLLSDKTMRDDLALLESQIKNYISQLASDIDMCIDPAFQQVMSMLGFNSDTPVSMKELNIDIQINPIEKSLGSYATNIGKAALPGFGIGMMLSLLTGGLAIPVLAGIGFFGKILFDTAKGTDIATLKAQVHPQLINAISDLKLYIQQRFNDFNTSLIEMLRESVQKLIEDMGVIVSDLEKLKKESAEAKKQKSILLENELKPMEQVLSNAKVFLTNPFDKTSSTKNTEPKVRLSNDEKTVCFSKNTAE